MANQKDERADPNQNLTDAVVKISDSMESLLKNGINRKAIIILLCHQTKLSQRDVKLVLDELPKMKKAFFS